MLKKQKNIWGGVYPCALVFLLAQSALAVDTDGDGIDDSVDNCIYYDNPSQADQDTDGLGDDCDLCPLDFDPSNNDRDFDGVGDACDGCPDDPSEYTPGPCGCGVPAPDNDNDGVADCIDNCPIVFNPGQDDVDNNGVGNACDLGFIDSDGDGVQDASDNCPNSANPNQEDADSDGAGDACDGCPTDSSKTHAGTCGCGVSDLDRDSDGWADCVDNCLSMPNAGQADGDLDAIGDACDNCPGRPNPDQLDSNGNGRGDACDLPAATSAAVTDSAPPTVRQGRKPTNSLDQSMENCGVGTGLGVAGVMLGLIGAGRRRR